MPSRSAVAVSIVAYSCSHLAFHFCCFCSCRHTCLTVGTRNCRNRPEALLLKKSSPSLVNSDALSGLSGRGPKAPAREAAPPQRRAPKPSSPCTSHSRHSPGHRARRQSSASKGSLPGLTSAEEPHRGAFIRALHLTPAFTTSPPPECSGHALSWPLQRSAARRNLPNACRPPPWPSAVPRSLL